MKIDRKDRNEVGLLETGAPVRRRSSKEAAAGLDQSITRTTVLHRTGARAGLLPCTAKAEADRSGERVKTTMVTLDASGPAHAGQVSAVGNAAEQRRVRQRISMSRCRVHESGGEMLFHQRHVDIGAAKSA